MFELSYIDCPNRMLAIIVNCIHSITISAYQFQGKCIVSQREFPVRHVYWHSVLFYISPIEWCLIIIIMTLHLRGGHIITTNWHYEGHYEERMDTTSCIAISMYSGFGTVPFCWTQKPDYYQLYRSTMHSLFRQNCQALSVSAVVTCEAVDPSCHRPM